MAVVRDLVAFVIVAGVPAGLVLAGYGAWRWARWMVTAGWAGRARWASLGGLALTVATVVNLGVPRTCDEQAGIRNLPVLAAITESGICQRNGLAQVNLAGLTGLAATLLLLSADDRRGRRLAG